LIWIRIQNQDPESQKCLDPNLTHFFFKHNFSSGRQVELNNDIYVQSYINAKQFLALAQCWLSAGLRSSSHPGLADLRLLMADCPVHPGDNMH
jgi:hypothetical protein